MIALPPCAFGRAGRIAVSIERTAYRGTGEEWGWEIRNILDIKRFRGIVVAAVKAGGNS